MNSLRHSTDHNFFSFRDRILNGELQVWECCVYIHDPFLKPFAITVVQDESGNKR